MNWAALNKEQKQLALLLGLVCAIVLFALFQFGVSPLLARARAAAETLQKVGDQQAKAERLLRVEARLTAERAGVVAEMGRAVREYIVPPENPLAWISELVYRHARAVGVELESVSGGSGEPLWSGPPQKDKKSARAFMPYRAQIAARGGYLELVRLFRAFERNNPYLCITDVSIESQEGTDDPGRLRILFAIEWPGWAQPQTLKALTAQEQMLDRPVESERK